MLGIVSVFGNQIKFPRSSNLYRELGQHSLRFLWVGKNVDRYIQFIRFHILLYIVLSVSAIITILALIILKVSNDALLIFLPIVLIAGVFVSFSERNLNGESFIAQEQIVLVGSYVVGSCIFAVVFFTIELIESMIMQVIYFIIMLGIVFLLYRIPLTYYNERIKTDGKILFVWRFIGRASHSLVIRLRNKETFDLARISFILFLGVLL